MYLGSADLMPRNLNRRIEILFPIEKRSLLRRVKEILDIYLRDHAKARLMKTDDTYVRLQPEGEEPPFSAQDWFMEIYTNAAVLWLVA